MESHQMWLCCSSHQWLCCWAPTQFAPQKSHQTHNSRQPIFEQLVLCSIQVPHPAQPQHSMLKTTRVSAPSHKSLLLWHAVDLFTSKGIRIIIEVHRNQVNKRNGIFMHIAQGVPRQRLCEELCLRVRVTCPIALSIYRRC